MLEYTTPMLSTFPWNPSEAKSSLKAGYFPGMIVADAVGNKYQMCVATADVGVTQVVSYSPGSVFDIDATNEVVVATDTNKRLVTYAGGTAMTAGAHQGRVLFVLDGLGRGFHYIIENNGARTITLRHNLWVNLGATTVARIWNPPWYVSETPALGTVNYCMRGVSLAAAVAASTKYFWVQIGGFGMADIGDDPTVTAGEYLVQDSQLAGEIEAAATALPSYNITAMQAASGTDVCAPVFIGNLY